MSDTPGLPAATAVGRVALRVADLDRPVEFYQTVIGLDLQRRDDDRAVLGAGGEPVVVLLAAPDASERTPTQTGLFHAAIRLPSQAAFGAAVERVRSRWELDGAADHGVSEAAYLSDPAGNGLELYRDRPRSAWPENDDGSVGMVTDPLDVDAIVAESDGRATVPADATVGHVHLEASSLSAARAFYAETLGLTVRQEMDGALFLAAGDYHHHVGVNVWNRRSDPSEGRGLAWFELVVPDAASLGTLRRRIEDRDVAVSAVADGAEVADPDGIAVADPDGIGLRVRVADDP